jgi:hypothetical protein
MFFLLRAAFWLTLALVLLPTGQTQQAVPGPKVDAVDALVAAGTAVADMSSFCDRQAEACVVGAQTAAVIGQRAQAGAKMVYEFINERVAQGETGSLPEPQQPTHAVARSADGKLVPVMLPVPVRRNGAGQSTLSATDLEPAWRGPEREAQPRRDGKRPA